MSQIKTFREYAQHCASSIPGASGLSNLNPAQTPNIDRRLSRLMIGSISDLVEVIDTQGTIIYSNLPASQPTKQGSPKLEGGKYHQVHDRTCPSCASCPLDQVLRTGSPLTRECPIELENGRRGWARQHLYPLRDENGGLKGVLRLVFDITPEKESRAREEKYLSVLEQSLHNRKEPEPAPQAQALSAREQQVLSFLAEGMSNQEIARLLCISPNTVKTHVTHIFNKLGVNDRTQAAVTATRMELI